MTRHVPLSRSFTLITLDSVSPDVICFLHDPFSTSNTLDAFNDPCFLDVLLFTPLYIGFPILGERPYKCPKTDCGKAFIQLSNLNQHLKVHSNARTEFTTNLVCPSCSRIFKTESSLYSHKCRPGQRSPSGSPPRETRGRPPKSAKSSHDNSFIPEQSKISLN